MHTCGCGFHYPWVTCIHVHIHVTTCTHVHIHVTTCICTCSYMYTCTYTCNYMFVLQAVSTLAEPDPRWAQVSVSCCILITWYLYLTFQQLLLSSSVVAVAHLHSQCLTGWSEVWWEWMRYSQTIDQWVHPEHCYTQSVYWYLGRRRRKRRRKRRRRGGGGGGGGGDHSG